MPLDHPPAAAEFDAYCDAYDAIVNASLRFPALKIDFFTKAKAGYLRALIRRDFGADARVLDIGCGTGNIHPLIAGGVAELHGVDVSGRSIDVARTSNPGVRYAVHAGGTLPYDDRSFDVAYTICVMHHVPPAHWPDFVREMRRVLRPGGVGLVFEHTPRNPLTRRVVRDCPLDKAAVLLPAQRTRRLLDEAGFVDTQARFILTGPLLGDIGRRIDNLAAPLPLGAQYFVRGRRT